MNKNLPNQKGSFQVNRSTMRGISMLLVLLGLMPFLTFGQGSGRTIKGKMVDAG